MKKRSLRKAFTLIEIIMVIVILGVVAMISTDIIAKMYQGYMRSKIISELQQKTELALDQITRRLNYRIKASAITRNSTSPSTFKLLSDDDNTSMYNMLEWIGYDNESFLGEYNTTAGFFMPGWNGFIDIRAGGGNTDENQTLTLGSTLSSAERTIKALSYGKVDLSAGALYPAMIFKKNFNSATPRSFGFDPGSADHNDTYRVRRIGDNSLQFTEVMLDKRISEQYYLAWSAYSLVPIGDDRDFNLTLHYNYQPWHGHKFDDARTEKSVIAEHVSTFRFTQTGNTIRIKLCIQDDNKTGTPIGFCKEKAVF